MQESPVLLLAYNRPEKIANLITSLRTHKPKKIIFAVDGPRNHIEGDREKVALVQQQINTIDWTDDIVPIFRESNMGLKKAVIDAVNFTIGNFGRAIIVEEDVIVGQDFISYMNSKLDLYKGDHEIAHISGYNVVPPTVLSSSESRITRYPESIAWATWDRAWVNYDDELTWARNASFSEIEKIVGSRAGAIKWKMNFNDAATDRISTWAYRWIASYWSKNQFALSPNRNLVTYAGNDEGTHTRMKAPWDELPVECLHYSEKDLNPNLEELAEHWIAKTVFGENLSGLTKGLVVQLILELRRITFREIR